MEESLKIVAKKIIAVIALIVLSFNITIADSNIIARVGEDVITSNDLEKRYLAHIKSNDLLPSLEEAKEIKLKLIHALINEKIILQGAKKLNIAVADQEIEEEIANIERLQNLPNGSFYNHHEQYGISKKDLKDQLYVKLAWQKILVDVIFPKHGQNNISDRELNEFIVQNHPRSVQIKGFIYKFKKGDQKPLKKLYKINKKNLCNINILKNSTGFVPKKVNTSLKNIKNNKIQQLAAFAKDEASIFATEKNNEIITFILCKKKSTSSEEELNKIRAELKNKKIAPYAEHYFKNLKKNKMITIYNIEKYTQ